MARSTQMSRACTHACVVERAGKPGWRETSVPQGNRAN